MYEFFTVVDAMHDDPTLFPTLSAPHDQRPFEWEWADGSAPLEFATKKVAVSVYTGNGWTQLRTFTDLTFTVAVTDARVVVHCEKYTKGGGWRGFGVGGLAFAAVANVVSHARAASRRKGKVLIGQVRYPWLVQAGAPADRKGRRNIVRLVVDAGTSDEPRVIALDIGVNERSGPGDYAAEIVRRAALARIGSRTLDDTDAATCGLLAGGPDRSGEPHWDVPGPIVVGAAGSLTQQVGQPADPVIEPAPAPAQLDARPEPEQPQLDRASPADGACVICGHRSVPIAVSCGRCGLPRERVGS